MKSLMIHVTENDIINGTPYDLYSCALALALEREIGYRARVEADEIAVYDQGPLGARVGTCFPSETVQRFMRRFDEQKRVAPCRLRMRFRVAGVDGDEDE